GDDSSGERDQQVRERALELCLHLFNESLKAFRDVLAKANSDATEEASDTQDRAHAQALFHVLEAIPRELYFASGAFDSKQGGRQEGAPGAAARRLFHEARNHGILDRVAECEFASVLHHLIELLEFFIPEDPDWVFATIARAVRSGTKDSYQFESQAA